MCYAKPGPRCSYHARQRMERKWIIYQAAHVDHQALVDSNASQTELEAHALKVLKAMDEHTEAMSEFFGTPAGQDNLKKIEENSRAAGNPRLALIVKNRREKALARREAKYESARAAQRASDDLEAIAREVATKAAKDCAPDCHERADCDKAGETGHQQCGRCPHCSAPTHHGCSCTWAAARAAQNEATAYEDHLAREGAELEKNTVWNDVAESLDFVTRWVDRNAKPAGDRNILLTRLGILRLATRAPHTLMRQEYLDRVTRWVDRNAKPAGDRRILLTRLGTIRAGWNDTKGNS